MATRVIGLDIGTNAVRAVEVSIARGKRTILKMGQVALSPGAVVAGEVVDPPTVAAALRRLWRDVGFSTRTVVVGVANARVVARMADLPALPDAEMRSSLPYQVQELIPIPVDEAELDFQVLESLPPVEDGGQAMNRVLLVAAQRDMLRSLLAAVEGAGLTPARVDLVSLAMLRALGDSNMWVEGDGAPQEAIVGVGSGVTNLIVHQSGVPRFVRMLPTGGQVVTEALAEQLGLSVEEAEGAKRALAEGVGAGDEQYDVAYAAVSGLVNEIAGSVEFHFGHTSEEQLHRIVLTGGGARLGVLHDALAEHIGVPVVHGQPFESAEMGSKVGLDPSTIEASEDLFSVALGLALSAEPLEGGARRITLLPARLEGKAAERKQAVLVGAGVSFVAASLLGLAFVRGLSVDAAQRDADDAEAATAEVQTQLTSLKDVETLLGELSSREHTAATVLAHDVDWPDTIREISSMLPPDVWITTFNASGPSGDKAGTVQIGLMGDTHVSVATFLQNVEKLDAVSSTWVGAASRAEDGHGLVTFNTTSGVADGAFSDRATRFKGDPQ